MQWYRIWTDVGKENNLAQSLLNHGATVLQPNRLIFFKHSGIITLEEKTLLPGYVFAKLNDPIIFCDKISREMNNNFEYCVCSDNQKISIRNHGKIYPAENLSVGDISFIKSCCTDMKPLIVKKSDKKIKNGGNVYEFVEPPKWAQNAKIMWYFGDKFKVKIYISTDGILNNFAFSVAAYSLNYSGCFKQQLDNLTKRRKYTNGGFYGMVRNTNKDM